MRTGQWDETPFVYQLAQVCVHSVYSVPVTMSQVLSRLSQRLERGCAGRRETERKQEEI